MNAQAAIQTIQLLGAGPDRVPKAVECLGEIIKQKTILGIYQAIWPEEYSGETGSIPDMMRSFYDRLTQKLPISDIDWLEATKEEGRDWFPEKIPLYSINPFDQESVSDWESLSAMALFELYGGSVYGADFGAREELKTKTGIEIPSTIGWPEKAFGKVKKEIGKLPGGARLLRAFEVINRGTGNYFVDNDDEMLYEDMVSWSVENVRTMMAEFKAAEDLVEEAKDVCKEFDGDLKRFAEMLLKVTSVWKGGGEHAGQR